MGAILERMRIPDVGLLLWFDSEYSGRDLAAERGDPESSFLGGFHPSGGVAIDFPKKVADLMADRLFRMLAWVGRDVIDRKDELLLTIVLAHELRHVEQFVFGRQLHYGGTVAIGFLSRLQQHEKPEADRYDSPIELDAELRAREVAVTLHGEASVHECYRRKATQHPGFSLFVDPQPVPDLRQLVPQLGEWLRPKLPRIREMALRPEEFSAFKERVESVDWDRLGLPHPLRP